MWLAHLAHSPEPEGPHFGQYTWTQVKAKDMVASIKAANTQKVWERQSAEDREVYQRCYEAWRAYERSKK